MSSLKNLQNDESRQRDPNVAKSQEWMQPHYYQREQALIFDLWYEALDKSLQSIEWHPIRGVSLSIVFIFKNILFFLPFTS